MRRRALAPPRRMLDSATHERSPRRISRQPRLMGAISHRARSLVLSRDRSGGTERPGALPRSPASRSEPAARQRMLVSVKAGARVP
jgi:hypothetical protein